MTFARTLFCSLALGVGVLPGALSAKDKPVYQEGGYAIGGYDAVAYFVFGKAMKGSPENALMWRGATWLFISTDTLTAFEMNPRAYAPQFGGYCAYSVAEGALGPSDPEQFTVFAGRLYLNRDAEAKRLWDIDPAAHAATAEQNWPAALGK